MPFDQSERYCCFSIHRAGRLPSDQAPPGLLSKQVFPGLKPRSECGGPFALHVVSDGWIAGTAGAASVLSSERLAPAHKGLDRLSRETLGSPRESHSPLCSRVDHGKASSQRAL